MRLQIENVNDITSSEMSIILKIDNINDTANI